MTDKLKVVAYLVSNLPSGEPGLCFEDERGDYGTEDFIPAFEALVRKADLDAALERVEVLEADAARYRYVLKHGVPFSRDVSYSEEQTSWLIDKALGCQSGEFPKEKL